MYYVNLVLFRTFLTKSSCLSILITSGFLLPSNITWTGSQPKIFVLILEPLTFFHLLISFKVLPSSHTFSLRHLSNVQRCLSNRLDFQCYLHTVLSHSISVHLILEIRSDSLNLKYEIHGPSVTVLIPSKLKSSL